MTPTERIARALVPPSRDPDRVTRTSLGSTASVATPCPFDPDAGHALDRERPCPVCGDRGVAGVPSTGRCAGRRVGMVGEDADVG